MKECTNVYDWIVILSASGASEFLHTNEMAKLIIHKMTSGFYFMQFFCDHDRHDNDMKNVIDTYLRIPILFILIYAASST